jgi:putative SOS response-associated peptidase YedK
VLTNWPDASALSPKMIGCPRYNIAPTQNVEVVRQHADEPKRFDSQMRWGLIPHWAKDASIGYKMINARKRLWAHQWDFHHTHGVLA